MKCPDPHEIAELVHKLLPHRELFLRAAPHTELLTELLNCAHQEGEVLAQAAASLHALPKAVRSSAARGIQADMAKRYSRPENVEYFGVLMGSLLRLEVPAPAPVESRPERKRPAKRLTPHEVEERLVALNNCAELLNETELSTPVLVERVVALGVTINDKRLSGIRTGLFAKKCRAMLDEDARSEVPSLQLILDVSTAAGIILEELREAQP